MTLSFRARAPWFSLFVSFLLLACSERDRDPVDGPDAAGGSGEVGSDAAAVSPDGGPPALDRTVASSFSAGFGFIYEGPNAVQTGVAPGAIDPARMAVVRGRVFGVDAKPIAGVVITAPHDAKLGSTKTQADGTFDFVINGGGAVLLAFRGDGYLPLQREVAPPNSTFERAPPWCSARARAPSWCCLMGPSDRSRPRTCA